MSRLDYCKNELIGHSCYDWEHNRCDMCNIFKAYCEGARRAKELQGEAPNPTGELISRADAIEAVCGVVIDEFDVSPTLGYEVAEKALSALPSAEAVHGEWIMHGEPPWYVRECSKCGTKWHQWSGDSNPNYCGNCGARMKGEVEK